MSIGESLRNPIWVRAADKGKEPVREWLELNKTRNAFDEKVLDYPGTTILAAHNNGTTYVYMPVQKTAMLESLGISPTASPIEVANSLRELVQATVTLASVAGMGEIYFLASDANTAQAATWLGFEEVKFKLYRKRL